MEHLCPVCSSKRVTGAVHKFLVCGRCTAFYLPRRYRARHPFPVEITDDTKLGSIFQKRLSDISSYIPKRARIIDVGSGNGLFVHFALSAGYHIDAMDIVPENLSALKTQHIHCYTSVNQIPRNAYDAVSLFDVIEHVARPVNFLAAIAKKLKPGGIVIITTPNNKGITTRIFPRFLTDFSSPTSEHTVLFSIPSLFYSLSENFTPVAVSTDTIINRLLYRITSPWRETLFARYLGDNIQVIARKSQKRSI